MKRTDRLKLLKVFVSEKKKLKTQEIETQSGGHFRNNRGMKWDRCAVTGFQGEEREC